MPDGWHKIDRGLWESSDGQWRIANPYKLTTELRHRWLVAQRRASGTGWHMHDDDHATLHDARAYVDKHQDQESTAGSRDGASPSRWMTVLVGCDDRPVPLSHVALTVGDRERSAAFYGRYFGLTERVHDDDHLLIIGSADGSLVALSEGAVPSALPRGNHFGFALDDADDVRRARELLRADGVTETEWQDDEGFVRVQVADPDGYRVELFARAPGAGLPRPPRSRWTSFVADPREEKPRVLREQDNPAHRLRVEHNRRTLLVHLSDEDGKGWTVMSVDRATRRWAVAQARRQLDAAQAAYAELYPEP